MSNKFKAFSGIKDVDLLILLELNDTDLLSTCVVNKYVSSICNDEQFWRKRLIKRFGESYLKYRFSASRSESVKSQPTWKQYYMQIIIDLERIRNVMKKQIRADLTVGRIDQGMRPFSEMYIAEFLEYNNANIENAAREMYEVYREVGELEDLRNAENDWYQEFLYNHIDL